MSRNVAKRYALLALLAWRLLGLLAIAVQSPIDRSCDREPVPHQIVSLAKQDDWQAFGGTWQYVDGVMTNNSDERGAKLMTGPEYWTNYSVEADVLLLGQYGDAGLIIRASDEETGVDAYHGYMAGLRDLDNTLMMGRADYGWKEYAAKAVSPRVFAQQWYHIKFLAFECDFAVSATPKNGATTTIAIRDPDCIKSGRFGLKSYNTGAQWRNVEIPPRDTTRPGSMIGNSATSSGRAEPTPSRDRSLLRLADFSSPLSAIYRPTVQPSMLSQSADFASCPPMCSNLRYSPGRRYAHLPNALHTGFDRWDRDLQQSSACPFTDWG